MVITVIVDSVLMGALHLRFSMKCRKKFFILPQQIERIYKCSAFATAYVLRHWDIEKSGSSLYEIIPHKMKDGYVYPKGILKLLSLYGFKGKYCAGNMTALKNEISKGNPVIVLIRVQTDKNWLHFVPVVGYDEQYIFVAESLEELINCSEQYYNRKIAIRKFRKLWDTSMLKMPFYRNTYIAVYKNER